MKHNEKVEFISSAQGEIDYIHDPVGLLKKIQSLFPLFSLDKLYRWVIKFTQDYGYFIFGDPELLIVMLVECVVLTESATYYFIFLLSLIYLMNCFS